VEPRIPALEDPWRTRSGNASPELLQRNAAPICHRTGSAPERAALHPRFDGVARAPGLNTRAVRVEVAVTRRAAQRVLARAVLRAGARAGYHRRRVWGRIACCVVLGGCGFQSRPGLGNDLPSDGAAPGSDAPAGDAGAGSDGGSAGGSTGTATCLSRWLRGGADVALSQPQLLGLATTTADRDPWISADGLRLYFDREPGQQGNIDIYLATRGSTAADFTTAGAVVNLDTGDDDSRCSLTGDEKLVVFASNHNTFQGKFQLFVAKRNAVTDPFGSPAMPDQALVASVNTAGDNYYDPFVSQDGLRLYVAPVLGGKQQIMLATRLAGQNFGPAVAVPGITSAGSADADPALSLDELILVFSSTRAAGAGLGATNLWYATRQRATDPFGAPQLIPGVNSNTFDGDPVLGADGCDLYFASTRATDGRYHLFHAAMTPPR
jgi:hypothetical protein